MNGGDRAVQRKRGMKEKVKWTDETRKKGETEEKMKGGEKRIKGLEWTDERIEKRQIRK